MRRLGMARPQIARATAALERLDRQAVTLQRLDVLEEKTRRLFDAGVTYTEILARRNEVNALADDGVQYDFNDALQLLYDETFGAPVSKEER
jgi:hypothetical protein